MRTLEQVYAAIEFGSLRNAEATMVELQDLRAVVDAREDRAEAPSVRDVTRSTMPAPYQRAA